MDIIIKQIELDNAHSEINSQQSLENQSGLLTPSKDSNAESEGTKSKTKKINRRRRLPSW